ncbi:MAG: cell shape determination protein CcmA [Gammaproteobacteria bacterium]|nr:MAG: cell shape determination protein CcmA [Gammaproteobacteria bacterium]
MARIKRMNMPAIATVLGPDSSVEGDLSFGGGMHLDGKIHGNVTGLPDTRSTLIVSQSGRIEGNVIVENLVLDGTIVGDVHVCNRVELAPGARVTGTVHYQLLEMAMGAEVNGQLVHVEEGDKPCTSPGTELREAREEPTD